MFRFNRRCVVLLLPFSMLCLTAQAQSATRMMKRKMVIAESAKKKQSARPAPQSKGKVTPKEGASSSWRTRQAERKPVEDKVYTIVEVQPTFRGNVSAWISEHLRYPAVAQENGIQGRVVVKFVVDKDGNINQAQVIRGVDPALDREALRLVNSMPKWNPGMNHGEPVSVWFTLPITFCFQ